MRWLLVLLASALVTLCACDSQRASAQQCRAIFDRLVAVELRELGFDDPVLTERRQAELARRFRQQLTSCVGRPLPTGSLACVAAANNSETLSHDCLQ